MSEVTVVQSGNLHDIEALSEITVRDGISLRPMRATDANQLLNILSKDDSIRENVSIAAKMHSPEDVERETMEMEADPECIRYAIVNENDLCIGLVSLWLDPGFFGQTPLPDTYGFGYFLDPDERGGGVVTDSVRQLMTVAANSIPNIQAFTAFCVDQNLDSIAVLTKLGFQPTDNLYPEPDNGWLERQYVRDLENE